MKIQLFLLVALWCPFAKSMQTISNFKADYRRKIALFDAYMSGKFTSIDVRGITFVDYADPEIMYSVTLHDACQQVYDLNKIFVQKNKREEFLKKAEEASRSLSREYPLSEERKYLLQASLMHEFLYSIDMTNHSSEQRHLIECNRLSYLLAWATHNPDCIKKACSLSLHQEPYVAFAQKLKQALENK